MEIKTYYADCTVYGCVWNAAKLLLYWSWRCCMNAYRLGTSSCCRKTWWHKAALCFVSASHLRGEVFRNTATGSVTQYFADCTQFWNGATLLSRRVGLPLLSTLLVDSKLSIFITRNEFGSWYCWLFCNAYIDWISGTVPNIEIRLLYVPCKLVQNRFTLTLTRFWTGLSSMKTSIEAVSSVFASLLVFVPGAAICNW